MKTAVKTLVMLALLSPSARVAQGQGEVDLDTVLERAVSYVDNYEEELGMIIGAEEYVQNATWMSRTRRPTSVIDRERRRLRSDFLLLPFEDRWYGVRSVITVDGNPVEAPETLPTSTEEIIANRTDTQYNIGGFERTFNVPTFALTFFRSDNLDRFSFEKRGDDRIEGYETWEIRFSEEVSPTLVRGSDGESRYANGRIWVDPTTGKILRTEIVFEVDTDIEPYRATMRVDYEENALLGILVPDSMEERYSTRFHTVDARAEYSNFQRFSVRVDTNPGALVADDSAIVD
jgi:hypothetical protein